MRYIDADKHLQKLRERRDTAIIWEFNCNDEATKDRAQEAILIFNECISELIDAPTVDVRENANGNWIKRIDHLDYGLIEFEGFECSLCGVKIWKDDYENIEFKFCPNCGAKMREVNYELETRAIN